ncbi:MAG: hypothetical protein HY318_12980 [Armatimonadetes bacterium]|nr:hypothetical protein [Armatimonadota bacterium]
MMKPRLHEGLDGYRGVRPGITGRTFHRVAHLSSPHLLILSSLILSSPHPFILLIPPVSILRLLFLHVELRIVLFFDRLEVAEDAGTQVGILLQ